MKNRLSVCLSLLCLTLTASEAPADPLEASFVHPPASARPWVYWFPLNGNLTKPGITADMEAMARVGIGGALYMEVNVRNGTPKGAADFAGPLWMEMIGHACSEAKRLGLEINFNNDAGWNGSGGPWITPELSMQKVVWSEVVVDAANNAPIVLQRPKAVRDFYKDIAVLAMPAPTVDSRIPEIGDKAFFIISKDKTSKFTDKKPMSADFMEAPSGALISRDQVIDISKLMDREGKLNWTPPAGKWLVMRFGCTTTGAVNIPAPASGAGLECDKLSKEAATFHFDHLMGKIVQQNRALTGQDKALVGVHIDSWENGAQNWTPLMREEFKRRRGYDMLPFLPALSGRIVGSTEITERFLWDLRQTVSDLLVENYAGTFRELAHKNGLRLTIEAYGEPADGMAYAGQCDEPMGEFWAWARFQHAWSCTAMASAGHTYGKPIIAAEAFTSRETEKWLGHPANIKDLGDWAFCEGINRFVFHRYAAQPWIKAAPGMSMGPFGLHYERTQTWWEQSKAWHEYLARCQSLLQQGQFVADIAYLAPEGVPREFRAPPEAEIAPHIRSGYGFDGCSAEVVLTRMSVKDGKIVLPDGMSYRALVLPPVETMTPALLAKIKELADAGAMIVGDAKPPRKSPSLLDMGGSDEQVKKTAAELWASGKILTGKTAQEFLAERGVPPDFSASPLLRYIHRRIGDADIYFVANPGTKDAVEAMAEFRISGKQPELWWPDTGRIESSGSFRENNGVTRVPLHLEPSGSVFVVFRNPSAGIDPIVELRHEGKLQWSLTHPLPAPVASKPKGPSLVKQADMKPAAQITGETGGGMVLSAAPPGSYELQTASGKTKKVNVPALPAAQDIAGPWKVHFAPEAGGPGDVTFDKLQDWSQRAEDGIKYYSGTAVYQKTFVAPPLAADTKWMLDLGRVEVMTEVKLNGKDLGILWKPPYQVDVTSALKPGENQLELKVVNLWINSQIGDENLPEDSDRNKNITLKSWPEWLQQEKPSPTGRISFTSWRLWKKGDPLVPSGLIGPVTLQAAETIPVK